MERPIFGIERLLAAANGRDTKTVVGTRAEAIVDLREADSKPAPLKTTRMRHPNPPHRSISAPPALAPVLRAKYFYVRNI